MGEYMVQGCWAVGKAFENILVKMENLHRFPMILTVVVAVDHVEEDIAGPGSPLNQANEIAVHSKLAATY